ncbi:MAG: uroporphyrinogen-III C-methyltransferase [bacterium]
MSGLVSIVGAGPGDPELISEKGIDRLRKADVIFHDKLSPNELIEDFCDEDTVVHDVGKRKGKVGPSQEEINNRLVEASHNYDRIVRLKGGDPFLFGRGGEETEYLADNDVDFEIIPGISSLTAVPASAGIPLTHRDHSSSVGVITGHFNRNAEDEQHNWKALSVMETLVVLMGVTRADHIASRLIQSGRDPDTPAAVIGWGATPRQESLITTLGDLKEGLNNKKPYLPGIIIVGDVVNCRQSLNWFENRPLFGQKIIVTRPESQSDRLTDRLTDLGAEAMSAPTINISPIESGLVTLAETFEQIDQFDWLIFTSRNAVRFFVETLDRSSYDLRILGSLKAACIGPGTAERLAEIGIEADLVPDKHRAEDLAETFLSRVTGTSNVLLPRSGDARPYLPDTLEEKGHQVTELSIYEANPPDPETQDKLKDLLSSRSADMITFTSSSTVENLFECLDEKTARNWLQQLDCAAIGPITAGTLKNYGVTASVVPDNYNLEAFTQAILDHFQTLQTSDTLEKPELD